MQIMIDGTVKEIADFVVAIQSQQRPENIATISIASTDRNTNDLVKEHYQKWKSGSKV